MSTIRPHVSSLRVTLVPALLIGLALLVSTLVPAVSGLGTALAGNGNGKIGGIITGDPPHPIIIDGKNRKLTICHATASFSNPYDVVSVSISSIADAESVSGHGTHDGPLFYTTITSAWGDLIPPFRYKNFTYGGSYAYNNGGQSFYPSCKSNAWPVKPPDRPKGCVYGIDYWQAYAGTWPTVTINGTAYTLTQIQQVLNTKATSKSDQLVQQVVLMELNQGK
ncbi:MAG TPA: hypothetical protein VGK81_10645, partial [Anaerolineae bacterium]